MKCKIDRFKEKMRNTPGNIYVTEEEKEFIFNALEVMADQGFYTFNNCNCHSCEEKREIDNKGVNE